MVPSMFLSFGVGRNARGAVTALRAFRFGDYAGTALRLFRPTWPKRVRKSLRTFFTHETSSWESIVVSEIFTQGALRDPGP